MPTISKTAEEAGQQIIRDGYQWGTSPGEAVGPITYGFRDTAPGYDNLHHVKSSFTQFSSLQIDRAELAVALWADVANITFERVGEGNSGPDAYSNNATILFSNYYSESDGSAAFAYYADHNRMAANDANGDVWINQYYDTSPYIPATYPFMALMHELGHALGLEHPGDYNANPGTIITYKNDAEYIEDSRQYTIMSYFSAASTGAYHAEYYPASPLMHDIVALQLLYGANMTTRTEDTIYGFNSNADRSVFQLSTNRDKPIFCIWDAGGNDTLDLSGFHSAQVLDLRAGSFSNAGGLTANISIAVGAIIENAIGGSGNDQITGNEADNALYGGAGRDILRGGGGSDLLVGGPGHDRLQGGEGADVFVFTFTRPKYSDKIIDFNPGEGDIIDLSAIDAAKTRPGDQAFHFIGGRHFTEHAGELRFKHGMVQGDTNGDGIADFRIAIRVNAHSNGTVDLPGHFHLSSDDFIL